jgi:hypothetical protein
VQVVEGANPCRRPEGGATSSENVTINGIQFLKEEGSDGAAGSLFEWTSYSTLRNNACITLTFILRSANPGNFPTPPPPYDKLTESAVFSTIINTFGWLN